MLSSSCWMVRYREDGDQPIVAIPVFDMTQFSARSDSGCQIRYQLLQPREGRGSGEPLPNGGLAEKPLMLEIGEPCPGKGCKLLLQPHIDVGFPAVIVIAVHLLQQSHVIVAE